MISWFHLLYHGASIAILLVATGVLIAQGRRTPAVLMGLASAVTFGLLVMSVGFDLSFHWMIQTMLFDYLSAYFLVTNFVRFGLVAVQFALVLGAALVGRKSIAAEL